MDEIRGPGRPRRAVKARPWDGRWPPDRRVAVRAYLVAGLFSLGAVGLVWVGQAESRGSAGEVPALEVRQGLSVWRKNDCVACHTLYGLGGLLGPDLTNVISRRGQEFVAAKIRAGGGGMPGFAMSDADIQPLVRYLTYVDGTGTYPPPAGAFPAFGIQRQPGPRPGLKP